MTPSFDGFFGALFQILLLTLAIHRFLRFFRGTRSAQMLLGLAVGLSATLFLTAVFRLDVIGWLLRWLFLSLSLALVVIFQPEIRHALAHLGSWRFAVETETSRKDRVEKIATAVERLALLRHGAIIAIERNMKLRSYEEGGIRLEAPLNADLLASIFYPNAPLHDGGVTIVGNTIYAVRCVFPPSETPLSELKGLENRGTRHRAALGLSEQTDAVVVVVSEETGEIRIFCESHYTPPLSPRNLRRFLGATTPAKVTDTWRRFLALGEEDGGETPPPPPTPEAHA
ncbi:MAG: diadenylate cyclase [Kiritimatiellia bacterium]|jgi:diadenylate cyclase